MFCAKVALQRVALQFSQKRFGRSVVADNLSRRFHVQFEDQVAGLDPDEALALFRSRLVRCRHGKLERARLLCKAASCLYTRAVRLGTMDDLDNALGFYREASKLVPKDHPDRAISLAGIADCLSLRFLRFGTSSDLEEALTLYRDALKLRPQEHPDRALSLANLAGCLHVRFKHHGTLADLDEALSLERKALQLRPPGHPDRATSLCNIAQYLHSRFVRLGELSDLDKAIALERAALKLRQKGHPDLAISLNTVASSLHSRFMQLGTLSDVDEAISLERSALELHPQGHPERALSMDNIALHFHDRFAQSGALSDLDEALALRRATLELRPEGHPNRAVSLGNIGDSLFTRFNHLGDPTDLDNALSLHRDALEQLSQGHPHRVLLLLNIARCLYARSIHLKTSSDLDEAAALARDILELCPRGHPSRASFIAILSQCLHAQSKLSHDRNDTEKTFASYCQFSDTSQALSLADLECVKQWIQTAEECQHSTTVLAYQTFLRLSTQYLATLLSLPHDLALLRKLTSLATVDAFSACVRFGSHADAVELLELGRDVLWKQLFHLSSPLDEVKASSDAGKKLAERFARLAFLLQDVLNVPPDTVESRNDSACRLDTELRQVVADIRRLPGLSRFLGAPLFSDIQSAATGGPIIIVNASQYGCDALIVLPGRDPIHVSLPITKSRASELSLELRSLIAQHAKRVDVTRSMEVLLRDLWNAVVFPIVKVLQEVCPHGSRIWWCPTAEFSLLPLHAAGSYGEGQPNFSDLYISSYTPTLSALVRARRQRLPNPSSKRPRFLFVGQAEAPGQHNLVSVDAQLSTVSQRIGPTSKLVSVRDQDAHFAKVAAELDESPFVHLACHGIADRKRPFKSGFALDGGLLKVEDVARRELQRAQFAYLPACPTSFGEGASSDEVIHLASALQFAGFSSVVGTMWEVDEAYTAGIASRFYNNMVGEASRLDHTRAARALHETMRGIRPSGIPLYQKISYIHIGA